MTQAVFIRTEESPTLPPPPSQVGIQGWLWQNVFASMANYSTIGAGIRSAVMAVATLAIGFFFITMLWSLIDFMLISAVWSDPTGAKGAACRTLSQNAGMLPDGTRVGACWPYIAANAKLIVYGQYPADEVWRVNIVYLVGALGLAWTLIEKMPFRGIVGALMLTVFPVFAFIMLTGGDLEAGGGFWTFWGVVAALCGVAGLAGRMGAGGEVLRAFSGLLIGVCVLAVAMMAATWFGTYDFGLKTVETSIWGGLLVTLVVALVGIIASLPLGVLLALGRRSSLPAVRLLSIVFIEFWRGVPLITVLYFSSVMLPFFLPEGMEFNKLLRALIGVALFAAAYMAEVVRGGLQVIPKGQYEGADSLGLSYWQSMRMIVLPQALVMVIPGIVNTFIGLFKDTSLVAIIGLFDLLGQVNATFSDSSWASPTQSLTGYLVVAGIFWIFCFGMSRYSVYMENKLHRGHAR